MYHEHKKSTLEISIGEERFQGHGHIINKIKKDIKKRPTKEWTGKRDTKIKRDKAKNKKKKNLTLKCNTKQEQKNNEEITIDMDEDSKYTDEFD